MHLWYEKTVGELQEITIDDNNTDNKKVTDTDQYIIGFEDVDPHENNLKKTLSESSADRLSKIHCAGYYTCFIIGYILWIIFVVECTMFLEFHSA